MFWKVMEVAEAVVAARMAVRVARGRKEGIFVAAG